MTTPNDYQPCPGTGQPGVGLPSKFGDMSCSVCGHRIATTKRGNIVRHANQAWWDAKKAVLS